MSRSPSSTLQPSTVQIEGLSRNVTAAHIHEIFSRYGTIKDLQFPLSPLGYGRGYAQVEYESVESAQKAIKCMNGGQLDGNILECTVYKAKKRRRSISPRQLKRGSASPPPPKQSSYSRSPPRHSRRYARSRSPMRR